MRDDAKAEAHAACEKLAHDYGRLADEWKAEELAGLFTPDGVFDRLGVCYEGRGVIRDFIANRPRDWWQRHESDQFQFQLAADGRSATGSLQLVLERGRDGSDAVVETVRARYHDQYALTDEGWRIRRREVRLA